MSSPAFLIVWLNKEIQYIQSTIDKDAECVLSISDKELKTRMVEAYTKYRDDLKKEEQKK